MRKLVNKRFIEALLVTLILFIMAIANFWHVVSHAMKIPGNRIYIGITHHYEDYFYYLSQLTQGRQGAWLAKNLYTSEPIPATILWFPNVLLGKIAALTNLPVWVVYDTSVFLVSVISLVTIYLAIRRIYPHSPMYRVMTLLIALASTSFFVLKQQGNSVMVTPYQYFYNYTAAFNRFGGVFHLVLQNILSLVSIVLGAGLLTAALKQTVSPRALIGKTLLFSAVLCLLMLINPLYVAINGTVIGIVWIGYLLRYRKRSFLMRCLFISFTAGLPLIVPFVLMSRTFSIPFYQYFRDWEASVPPTDIRTFFLSMGLIGPLAILGIFPFIRKATPLRAIGTIWTILPIILYFTDLPRTLHLPFFRLHQPASYVFLASMASETLTIMSAFITARVHWLKTWLLASLLLSLFLIVQSPVLFSEIAERNSHPALDSFINYLDPLIFDGLTFLANQPKNGTVLAFNVLELFVPAFSGHTVYVGHRSLTYEYERKIIEVARFYRTQMTREEAEIFLSANNIRYILWHGPDGDLGVFLTAYPFLNKIYENREMIIFTR